MKKLVSILLSIFFYTIISSINGSINIVSFAVSADVTVAKDGTGDFSTVQAAIDSVPSDNSKKFIVFIKNGTYKEVVTIRKNNIHLIGESSTGTIITYDNYAGKLKPDNTTYGTSGSASFYLYGTDAILENLTIENTFDENISTDGKQAVAAYIRGDRQIIKDCIFIGNQDTLYAHSGRQYYTKCKIIGDTDFIFGGATAVFDNCKIISTPRGGYVTAASTELGNYGYLFLNCSLESDAPKNSTYLGRPWRPDAYVVYKNCYLDDHIRDSGWTTMSGNLPENARFFEYKNTGPGAVINSTRRQLKDSEAASFTVENLLKSTDRWNPISIITPDPILITNTGTIQAEDGLLYQSVTETKNAGFTGSSYVNYDNVANSYSEWKVNMAAAGKYTLIFRYSNGSTISRPMDISINGRVVGSIAFNPTDAWTSWTTKAIDVDLVAGTNTIRSTSTSSDGGPNIDKVDITASSSITYGDLNGDGQVNAGDYSLLRRYILGIVNLDQNKIAASDLNLDGRTNTGDYTILRRFLLDIVNELPMYPSSAATNSNNN